MAMKTALHLYLKHSLSCLSDQRIQVDVDRDRREVRLTMDTFDSALVADVVTRILPAEHQVEAYRDDAQKNDATWLTRCADFALRIDIGGIPCRAQVVKLMGRSDVAVTLEPLPCDEAVDDRSLEGVDTTKLSAIAERMVGHGRAQQAYMYRRHLLVVGLCTTPELRAMEQDISELLGHPIVATVYEPDEWAQLLATNPAWAAIVAEQVVQVFPAL
jgi:hypothetical protein